MPVPVPISKLHPPSRCGTQPCPPSCEPPRLLHCQLLSLQLTMAARGTVFLSQTACLFSFVSFSAAEKNKIKGEGAELVPRLTGVLGAEERAGRSSGLSWLVHVVAGTRRRRPTPQPTECGQREED